MIRKLLLRTAVVGLAATTYICLRATEPAVRAQPNQQPVFCVTARLLPPPEQRHEFAYHWDTRPYFEARCIVTNMSNTRQVIETFSCSWNKNWQTSDPRLLCLGWPCRSNVYGTIVLSPGERYEKVLPLTARPEAKGKTITFRVGFSPAPVYTRQNMPGSKPNVTWSAPLSVSIPK